MAVTVIDSRVKFRKDQRPNKSDCLYGVDDVKEENFFFLIKCSAGCLPVVFEPHVHLNCSVVMVGMGVRRLHFPAFLGRWLPVMFCQVKAQAGNQKVEHGKTIVLHFFYPLLLHPGEEGGGMAVSFTKSQSQLQQPPSFVVLSSLFSPSGGTPAASAL